ncbi:MAG: diguanylate cyclase, partial [Gammaproteobacteria bacterium]|nr:diguanylate cyclase [Gammaproteobacteria bacterium]
MFLPIRVLILEDNEDDCLLILRELRRGGFEPTHLRIETQAAMETALNIEDWDIVISDYTMPEFSAPAALKILKKSKKELPFIVVSGNVGEVIAVQLMQHGASDFISKENLSRLCPAIQRELTKTKNRKQIAESESFTNRLWDIFNHSLNEIYVFSADTFEFITVNEPALHNLGYTFDEIKRKHPWDIKPQFTEKEFREKLKHVQTGKNSFLYFETEHERKNGTTYPVEIRLQLSSDKEPIFYAIILDITERKKAMDKIESLARFPEENPQPVLRLNYFYDILYNNPSSNELVKFWASSGSKKVPSNWKKIIDKCHSTGIYQYFEDQQNFQTYSWLLFPSNLGDYINCYGHDITAQKQNEKILKQSFQVFENISEGIMICDKNELITAINPAFSKITGFAESEVIGQFSSMINSSQTEEIFLQNGKTIALKQGKWQGEHLFRKSNGDDIPVNLSISTIKSNNEITSFIYVFSDIAEHKLTQQHIHNLSYFDPLTNLPNRLHIHEKLYDLLQRSTEQERSIAIIYLNINRFKTINESLGHQTADKALAIVAQRLQAIIPENSFMGRMGADEFIIVIDKAKITGEENEVIRNISRIFKLSFQLQGQETYLNVTLGVSHYPENGSSPEELIKHAESAIVHAKRQEKFLEIYSNELHTRSKEHIRLETNLRKALER